ncbi:PD-(D/E)XK motif protein [Micromonospora sp. LOL_014]|uniref:PD-(D/E)XK motif protein n=1 Tax=Micromonospora sp. LOL_014 TaxID=3345415 RepID=UPI003A852C53
MRHLSPDSLDRYLNSGAVIEHLIAGEPRVTLLINPEVPMIGLRTRRHRDEILPQVQLENVAVVAGHGVEGRYLEIRVTDPKLFGDAHPVLCAIADRIQLQGMSLSAAVSDTLHFLGRLLRHRQELSREREIGLCGELILFIGVCRQLGAEMALATWRGPNAEEHDFGFCRFDVEVKTSALERRMHWINSLTQLSATGDRPLYIASHLLTEAASDDGWKLGDLVTIARREVESAGLRQDLERRLSRAGWIDYFTETCRTRWRRRVPSVAYVVDEKFPRLTPGLLTAAGVELNRVTEARYRVDLTGYSTADPTPPILAQALSTEMMTI